MGRGEARRGRGEEERRGEGGGRRKGGRDEGEKRRKQGRVGGMEGRVVDGAKNGVAVRDTSDNQHSNTCMHE